MAIQISGNGKYIYTDIDPNFTRSPKSGDLLTIRDEQAIKTSVKNLLSTSFGERLFQPTIGGSLRQLLFEPIDAITAMEIRDRILQTLLNYEPRISNVIVDVVSRPNENEYRVTVEYGIRPLSKVDRVTVTLERIR